MTLRIGIVGVGSIAEAHIASLRYLQRTGYNVEVVAGVNRSEEHRRRAQEQYGIPRVFADARQMVEQIRPDALYVLVPPTSLAEVAGKLIPYGIPILMEKPPGLSVEECSHLAELAARHQTPVMVGFNRRFYSLVEKALALCEARGGLLGMTMEITESPSSLQGQEKLREFTLDNVLVIRTIHCIDLIRRVAGDIAHVEPLPRQSGLRQNSYVALLLSRHNIPVTCYAYDSSVGNWNYTLFAPGLRIRFANLETAFVRPVGEAEKPLAPDTCDVEVKPGMVAQSGHFLDCILAGGTITSPACSIADAVETMKLADAFQTGTFRGSAALPHPGPERERGIQPHERLRAIHRASEHIGDRTGYVCLDRNERVPTFPRELFDAMLATLDPKCFTAYPDSEPLYRRLSEYLGVLWEQLLLIPGSDSGIKAIFQAYVRPGDRVVMPEPTYAMYPIYTRMFGATTVQICYKGDLTLDPQALMVCLEERPRLLALPNPDQPVGAVIDPPALRTILQKALKEQVLTIVDEAYFPFYPETVLDYLSQLPNVVILRTLSKVAGLAGLRLGYATASPDIIENLKKVRAVYDVSGVAIRIGQFILEHPSIMDDYVKEVAAGKELLQKGCRALGLNAPPSHTNFQLIGFPEDIKAGRVVTALKDQGYLVRGPLDSFPLYNFIRVTLGPPEVMKGFVEALYQALAHPGVLAESVPPGEP
ncbi:MAG: aminotransferase class I/II-fold pyridoxal phosphate-dependent enzyme [Dehalococcoidia bacterium]